MRAAPKGFTLIELVVAMAVMSLLSLLLLQSLSLARQSWDHGAAVAQRLDSVATVQASLRRALSGLLPLQGPAECGGDANALTFIAASPAASLNGSLARYRLAQESTATTQRLRVTWCDYSAAFSSCPATDGQSEVLLDGLQSASLRYFLDGGWTSSWADCSHPPQLIDVAVEFPAGDRRIWPAFAVKPVYAAAADCVFDLVSMQCRRF